MKSTLRTVPESKHERGWGDSVEKEACLPSFPGPGDSPSGTRRCLLPEGDELSVDIEEQSLMLHIRPTHHACALAPPGDLSRAPVRLPARVQ